MYPWDITGEAAPHSLQAAVHHIILWSVIISFITLLTRFGLAAFDDVVAMTVRAKHGYKYHDTLLLKQSAAWHIWG